MVRSGSVILEPRTARVDSLQLLAAGRGLVLLL